MEVKVLHMNGGEGETSYAKNSSIQTRIIQTARSAVEDALVKLCSSAASFPAGLSVADLGCSSGPNALSVVTGVVDTVEERCRQLGRSPPEFHLFMNDLPGNDFNSLFRSLQAFHERRESPAAGGKAHLGRCFFAGVPGSFHGRLFPSRSIHFFHSSSSLHWLSQAPPELQQDGVSLNRGSIYIARESPPAVVNAYAKQFEKDVSEFLRCRSEELAVGGRMVISLPARRTPDPKSEDVTAHWVLLSQVLMDLVQEGYITEAMVDSFNMPMYAPFETEMEGIIQREGSFSIEYLGTLEVVISNVISEQGGEKMTSPNVNAVSNTARYLTNSVRAAFESMFANHFGCEVMEDLYTRYQRVLEENPSLIMEAKMSIMVISLVN